MTITTKNSHLLYHVWFPLTKSVQAISTILVELVDAFIVIITPSVLF